MVLIVKIAVFWLMMPHSLVVITNVSEECVASICNIEQSLFYLEDGSRMFLQNVRICNSVPQKTTHH
jgi:hypothetical protein